MLGNTGLEFIIVSRHNLVPRLISSGLQYEKWGLVRGLADRESNTKRGRCEAVFHSCHSFIGGGGLCILISPVGVPSLRHLESGSRT